MVVVEDDIFPEHGASSVACRGRQKQGFWEILEETSFLLERRGEHMKRGARGDVWKIAGDFGKGNNTGNTGIDSTNWIPLFFYTILGCFLCMRRFSFWCLSVRVGDSCIFMESELTCTCTMLEFQPVFRTLFWVFVCGTAIHVLFFTFWNPFEIRFGHSSWLVDIRNEACMGSSHSRSWFSFLVVPLESFVLSIATKKSHLHLHSIRVQNIGRVISASTPTARSPIPDTFYT